MPFIQHRDCLCTAYLHLSSTTCLFCQDPPEAQQGPPQPWSLDRAERCGFLQMVCLLESLLTCAVGHPFHRQESLGCERSSDLALTTQLRKRQAPKQHGLQTQLCTAIIEKQLGGVYFTMFTCTHKAYVL